MRRNPTMNGLGLVLGLVVLALGFISCEKVLLDDPVNNDPEANFEALWTEFDRYYALFDVKKVDWNEMYAIYRPQINPGRSEDELWAISTSMLRHLNDGHVYMFNADNTKSYYASYLQDRTMNDFSIDLVTSEYLDGNYHTTGDGWLYYGRIPNTSFGYLYIQTFAGANDIWSQDIDIVLRDLSDVTAMIIDIRANGGGTTVNYQTLASAFVDRPIDYFYWQSRNGPKHSDFEARELVSIAPRTGHPQFTGPIVLLTNRFSASSSDHFAWIFKNYLPYATLLGDTTVGCFGSVPSWRVLPNGWVFRLTARLTTTPDGLAPDSLGGIVPDILVINTAHEIGHHRDHQLERAINFLRSPTDGVAGSKVNWDSVRSGCDN